MLDSEETFHSGLLPGSRHLPKQSKLPWCLTALATTACVWLFATREALPSAKLEMSKGAPPIDNLASFDKGAPPIGNLASFEVPTLSSHAGQIIINEHFGAGSPVSPTPQSPPQLPGPLRSYNFMQLNGFGPDPPTSTAAYAGSSLAGKVTLDHGIQNWVAPHSGNYHISAAGASTFRNEVMPYKGRGAAVAGMFNLTAGTHLKILVGQMGLIYKNDDGAAGGGGASWVWIADADEPLLVAGGAGGSREQVGSDPLQYISGSVNGHTRTHCLNGRLLANPFDEHCTTNMEGGFSRGSHCDGGGGGGWTRDGAHGGESTEGGHAIKGSSTPGKGGNSGGCGGHDPASLLL